MIVYVESNWLLEIALEQEQNIAASTILELAEAGSITLAIPSFALSEPFSTLAYRRNRRRERLQDLQVSELIQLRRSASHRRVAERLDSLLSEMGSIANDQLIALETVVSRVMSVGRTIPPPDRRILME
ncbi:MAG: hypothetical protein AB7R89_13000 [Dehalococcoidia bacterium]